MVKLLYIILYLGVIKLLVIKMILFAYYIIYKFCKMASTSDDKKLEDKLFLEAYVLKKTY